MGEGHRPLLGGLTNGPESKQTARRSNGDVPVLVVRTAWQFCAACRGVGSAKFYPTRGGNLDAARELCAKCMAVGPCAAYEIDNADTDGVWGGMTA